MSRTSALGRLRTQDRSQSRLQIRCVSTSPGQQHTFEPGRSDGARQSTIKRPSDVVMNRGRDFFFAYPRQKSLWRIFSRSTIFSVGLIGKFFVKLRHRTQVKNSERLAAALARAKNENRGVITVMNHISILDDPLVWGATSPLSTLARVHTMRWALGASDICFKNKAESLFFSSGKVLSVERFGRGPDQPAMDCAVSSVTQGHWVHLYPEGFVHQPHEPYAGTLRYFHWGVSRLVLEPPHKAPLIVPIYATGLQQVFPEDKVKRTFGYGRNIPLQYNFGEPLDETAIEAFREKWVQAEDEATQKQVRSDVANYIRDGVLETKRQAGDLLEQDKDPRLGMAEFWKTQTLIKLKGSSLLKKKEKKERQDNQE